MPRTTHLPLVHTLSFTHALTRACTPTQPLTTFELYSEFMGVEEEFKEAEEARVDSIRQLVSKLPKPNLATLAYTVNHLRCAADAVAVPFLPCPRWSKTACSSPLSSLILVARPLSLSLLSRAPWSAGSLLPTPRSIRCHRSTLASCLGRASSDSRSPLWFVVV